MDEDAMTEATVAAKDRAAALTATLDTIPGSYDRIYLAPEARVMFMSLNKNACTSLKWMMAGLAGEDLTAFEAELMPVTTPEDVVHNPRNWKVAPRFKELSTEAQGDIHPDNGWFVFAVVRDPRVRLFSAWQNKLLLQNPVTLQFAQEPWYPRHPLTAQTVVEDFARFVELFERDPQHRLRAKDAHFRDQTEMLAEDVVPYSKIYDIRELKQLRADVQAHLDAVGWHGDVHLPRFNDTPLRPNVGAFGDGIRERIEKMYAADFERFGDLWDYTRIESEPPWSDAALAEAELRSTFGRRIGELRQAAIDQRTKAQAGAARVGELEQRVASLDQKVGNLQRRLAASEATHAASTASRLREAAQRARRRRTPADRRPPQDPSAGPGVSGG